LKLAAIIVLALMPFAGIALLLWKGPRSSFATANREAARRREAKAAEEDRLRRQIAKRDKTLRAQQGQLLGAKEADAGAEPQLKKGLGSIDEAAGPSLFSRANGSD